MSVGTEADGSSASSQSAKGSNCLFRQFTDRSPAPQPHRALALGPRLSKNRCLLTRPSLPPSAMLFLSQNCFEGQHGGRLGCVAARLLGSQGRVEQQEQRQQV